MGSADVHSVHRSEPLGTSDSPVPGPDGKFAKSAVQYGEADSPREACAKCRFFQAGTCKLVRGKIGESDWCDLWTPRTAPGTGESKMKEDANSPNPDDRAHMDGDSDDDDALADKCKACNGSGKKNGKLCRACGGSGKMTAKKTEEINPKKLQPTRLSEQYLADFYDLSKVRLLAGGDGDTMSNSWVPVFPEGTFHHPEYGELVFDDQTIPQYIKNFDERVRHIDIAVDVDHRNEEAVGWVKRLDWRRGVGLFGLVEWNRLGEQKLGDKQYRYISAQFGDYLDEQTRETVDNVISALTITNFPFLKRMSAIQLSEQDQLRKTYRQVAKLHRRFHKGNADMPGQLHKTIDLWLEGRTLKALPTNEQRLAEGRAIVLRASKFLAAMGPTGSSKAGGSLPHEKQDFAPGDNADEGGPALDENDMDDDDASVKRSKRAGGDGAPSSNLNPMKPADKAKKAKRAALLAQLAALDDDADMDDEEMDDDADMDDDEMKKSRKAYDQDDAYGEGANMDVQKAKSAQKTRARGQVPSGAGGATGHADARPLAGQTGMSEGSARRQLAEVSQQLAEVRRELREQKVSKQVRELSDGPVAFGKEVIKEFKKVALADKGRGEELFRILNLIREENEVILSGEYGDGGESDEDSDVIGFTRSDDGGIAVGMSLSKQARAYAKEHQLDFNDPEDRLMAFEAVTTGGAADGDKRPARAKGWR